MARQVLFIRNDPTAPEALLGEMFVESGFDVSVFDVVPTDRPDDPMLEVRFPKPARYDVIVPLGARWSAYDDTVPWISAEMDLLRSALASGAGVLGVCFGGQLLARALGGTVTRSPHPEIGWCDVQSDDEALVPGGPWFQWHFDRFSPPLGSREVARNARATQAFAHGRALGLQFHPEVDGALVEQWINDDAGGDIEKLGMRRDDLRARTGAELDDAVRRLRLLVAGFLAGMTEDVQNGAHGLR